jgi:hypothetical protein
MKKNVILILIFSTICIMATLSVFLKKGFYEYTHDSDLLRLPLIEPYELYSADIAKGEEWNASVLGRKGEYMTFEGLMNDSPHVDSVSIKGCYIFLYSSSENFKDTMCNAWFVFNTNSRQGTSFRDYKTFYETMKKIKIDHVNFYDPKEVFMKFDIDHNLPPEWDSLVQKDKESWW